MPKQIAGNVYWIENSRQTIKLVDAEAAFSDVEQAVAQVQFAESSGVKKEIRLARLAYRQYQGMRYRGENKAKPSKPIRAKSLKKPAGRKTQGKTSTAKRKARNK
jgi:hypothetical protein